MSRFKLGSVLLILVVAGLCSSSSKPVRSVWTNIVGGPSCDKPAPDFETLAPSHRIALIDDMKFEYPNPGFVSNLNASAGDAGYALDYYPPTATTLDFFANLPNDGYSMIIFRNHGEFVETSNSGFVTSQAYSRYSRVADQLLDRLNEMNVSGKVYFGITSGFVTQVMCGEFRGTIVLAMWCGGTDKSYLDYLPRAFVSKGAAAFVGWDKQVTIGHTDAAIQALSTLLLRGSTVGDAVHLVNSESGPDPVYGSLLSNYPSNSSIAHLTI